jgi:PTS system N-acetylglucosamine-specific IIC component
MSALERVVQALGGRKNIANLHVNSSRLCVSVRDAAAVDETALRNSVRAVARPAANSVHLILGPDAQAWAVAFTPS